MKINNGIDKALGTLSRLNSDSMCLNIDARVQLAISLLFIVFTLSIPLSDPAKLIWMLPYPIIMAEASGKGYARVFKQSLIAMPFIILIGIFNPILDNRPAMEISGIVISEGWITFLSIVLRGLMCVQALLVLINACSFREVCRALQGLGCPVVLVTQLMMLYRYIGVLLEEAQTMNRARVARGYGRRSYPLKMWGEFVGQLLMRSMRRAQRINLAMLARGFDGNCFVNYEKRDMRAADWFYFIGWAAALSVLRFVNWSYFTSMIF